MMSPSELRSTTIYLVRHGESHLNREKRVSGQFDTTLSPNGFRQARRLADQLRHVTLTAVYTSALSRTIETARATALLQNLPIQIATGLNELHMGVLEGRYRDARDPEACAIWEEHQRNKRHYCIPGGECFRDLMERVTASLDSILAHEAGGTVLIVGHRNVNRIVFGSLMHRPEDEWPDLSLKSRYLYQIVTGRQPHMSMVSLKAHTDDSAMTQSVV